MGSRHPLPPVFAGAPPAGADAALVLVHGRDQDPSFMTEVAGRIGRDDLPWVLPVATGRAWYAGRYMDPTAEDRAAVADALGAVERAIDATGLPPSRVALIGFSQGACLLAELLRTAPPRPFAAVAILTGALVGTPAELDAAPRPDLAGLPVHCSISRDDSWIALADAQRCARFLEEAGAEVDLLLTGETEHHVSDAEAAAVARLLQRLT